MLGMDHRRGGDGVAPPLGDAISEIFPCVCKEYPEKDFMKSISTPTYVLPVAALLCILNRFVRCCKWITNPRSMTDPSHRNGIKKIDPAVFNSIFHPAWSNTDV